jgi:hypothetical protein
MKIGGSLLSGATASKRSLTVAPRMQALKSNGSDVAARRRKAARR